MSDAINYSDKGTDYQPTSDVQLSDKINELNSLINLSETKIDEINRSLSKTRDPSKILEIKKEIEEIKQIKDVTTEHLHELKEKGVDAKKNNQEINNEQKQNQERNQQKKAEVTTNIQKQQKQIAIDIGKKRIMAQRLAKILGQKPENMEKLLNRNPRLVQKLDKVMAKGKGHNKEINAIARKAEVNDKKLEKKQEIADKKSVTKNKATAQNKSLIGTQNPTKAKIKNSNNDGLFLPKAPSNITKQSLKSTNFSFNSLSSISSNNTSKGFSPPRTPNQQAIKNRKFENIDSFMKKKSNNGS